MEVTRVGPRAWAGRHFSCCDHGHWKRRPPSLRWYVLRTFNNRETDSGCRLLRPAAPERSGGDRRLHHHRRQMGDCPAHYRPHTRQPGAPLRRGIHTLPIPLPRPFERRRCAVPRRARREFPRTRGCWGVLGRCLDPVERGR